MSEKKKIIITSVVIFFLVFGMLTSIFMLIEERMYYQQRERHHYVAANQASIIEGCMDTVIARTYTLSAMVAENKGDTKFFDSVAKQIYDEVRIDTGVSLKNIALAPGGVVKTVYPLEGNEGLIGLDFLDEAKEGNEAAIEAYKKGKLIISNPFELKQGGIGMGGRLPVFLEEDGSEQFWGFVTVTLDYEKLMENFKLETLSNMGVNYKLWFKNENGKKVILAESEKVVENPVVYKAKPKNLVWNLEVSPSGGWYSRIEMSLVLGLLFIISAAVVYVVITRHKIREANEKLKILATKDSLTECYSRHYVNNMLIQLPEGEWRDATSKYSLAIVDIDKFKEVNDGFGHDMGDRAIVAVANALKSICDEKRGDCVIRHGGDEFIVLLNNMTEERIKNSLENAMKCVRDTVFKDVPELKLTISIGVALYKDRDSTYYSLLKEADEKLYVSKENGRNRFTL